MGSFNHERLNNKVRKHKTRQENTPLPGTPASITTPGENSKFKELARRANTTSVTGTRFSTILGEWLGQERNANRSARTDPFLAMAQFVYGTITPGCGCEECDSRRDTVMMLIYNHNLDSQSLSDAVHTTPPLEPGS